MYCVLAQLYIVSRYHYFGGTGCLHLQDLFNTVDGESGFLRNVVVCRPNCVVLHCRRLILILSPNLIQSNFCFQGGVQTNKCSRTAAWCGRQYACGAAGSAEEQYLCRVCESKTGPDPAWDKDVPVQHRSSLVGVSAHRTNLMITCHTLCFCLTCSNCNKSMWFSLLADQWVFSLVFKSLWLYPCKIKKLKLKINSFCYAKGDPHQMLEKQYPLNVRDYALYSWPKLRFSVWHPLNKCCSHAWN